MEVRELLIPEDVSLPPKDLAVPCPFIAREMRATLENIAANARFDLADNGWKQKGGNPSILLRADHDPNFTEAQNEYVRARWFLRQNRISPKVNRRHSPYGLKGIAERFFSKTHKDLRGRHESRYISTGMFILAAVTEGFMDVPKTPRKHLDSIPLAIDQKRFNALAACTYAHVCRNAKCAKRHVPRNARPVY